jgi:hypothetical protein
MDKPVELGGVETHIADLNTSSAVVTSKWGDEHYFIRHQDMAEDLAIHPEWTDYTEHYGRNKATEDDELLDGVFNLIDQANDAIESVSGYEGCPFAFLFEN